MQANIQQLLEVPAIRQYEKYLGLPALVGEPRNRVSSILKKGFGESSKGGRKKFFPMQVGRFL